jgi:surfactin synthase thioesterase subunit
MPAVPKSSHARWWTEEAAASPNAARLYCFHNAGGNAVFCQGWGAFFGAGLSVRGVTLPGRAWRFREAFSKSVYEIAEEVSEAIHRQSTGPVALFGVSLGALVAYETALALERQGRKVAHLFVASFCAPEKYRALNPVRLSEVPADQLVEHISSLGGTPAELLNDAEFRDLFLGILRSDFRLLDDYPFAMRPLLRCPITAFGGEEDRFYRPESMGDWRKATVGHFEQVTLPGGHLFPLTDPASMLRQMRTTLASTIFSEERACSRAPEFAPFC